VATTRSRPRGRENARPSSGGVFAEHASKIYGVAITGVVIIIAFLALTSIGHVIDLAVQHFMLFYAGVFALIALCAAVGLGLVATDRMVLNPGHRVLVQSAHRAASFGALVFLVIHIVTEILAQRVHVIDAFVPFLSPFKTFYIGLGTISSDLILLLVITGVLRKRFTAHGKAWRWRAIHYTSYVAFVFGVWHGLLGGRPGKPYVDWSYGFVVAFVAIGLAVRVLANSLHPKESLSAAPVSDLASSSSAPMRAAAMFARTGMGRAVMPAATPAMAASAAMSSAPAAATALPAGTASDGRQPVYEPGYEGPPRYAGAPSSGSPASRAGTGPMPRAGTGPMHRAGTGPMPRAGSGPIPQSGTGSMPRAGTGPIPRTPTGPFPAAGGQGPAAGWRPRPATGPMPRANTGSMPVVGPEPGTQGSGRQPVTGRPPAPRPGSGPIPQSGTGSMPRAGTGPIPRTPTGPIPAAGWRPRPGSGPIPQAGTRPIPQGGQQRRDGSQPPWDDDAWEADASFMYREPGPGMPGYRTFSDRSHGGDDLR
jgi:hypothetical protein